MGVKRWFSLRVLGVLSLFACLLLSCSEEAYEYPSVKLEFLTAQAGPDGYLRSVITDEGKRLGVAKDLMSTRIEPNSAVRIVANYGLDAATDGAEQVKLFSTLKTVSPLPQAAEKFTDGIKTDPVDMLSIWMGLDYLNMILEIQGQNGKHLFHFIEEEMTYDFASKHKTVRILLYHDAGNDVQAYTKRAYVSLPLRQYATEGVTKVTVYFSLHTYSGEVKTYQFDYNPS